MKLWQIGLLKMRVKEIIGILDIKLSDIPIFFTHFLCRYDKIEKPLYYMKYSIGGQG